MKNAEDWISELLDSKFLSLMMVYGFNMNVFLGGINPEKKTIRFIIILN